MIKEAMLYEKLDGRSVRCALCSHRCKIAPSKRGICGVRENREGTLYTLVYGPVIAASVDPIEKKPIYHLYPGSESYSIAAVGCNFRCTFCQNHEISQMPREEGRIAGREMTPREVVNGAIDSSSKSISYTYTEPTIFFEFAQDTGPACPRGRPEEHLRDERVYDGRGPGGGFRLAGRGKCGSQVLPR